MRLGLLRGAFGLLLLGCSSGAPDAEAGDLSATGNPGQSADAPPAADASAEAAAVPGARVCDESLAIFGTGNKYDVSGSDEVYAKVRSLGSDNVWVVDKTSCRTYFKVNKYLLRVESLFDANGAFPRQIEAATIVGAKASGTGGAWSFDLAARTRTLCIVGTSTDEFKMGGFPHGVKPGALVVGSTQTYGGATSDAILAETHAPDAKRAFAAWTKFRDGERWGADVVVVGHSAGSVPAEDVVVTNGGQAYLYGTPKYADASTTKTGNASAAGRTYALHIANHAGDPVSGSYQCSDAYYWCKQFLHRTGSSDIDAASATCAVGKDPKCVFILKQLDDSSAWAAHDYSDMTLPDAG